MNIEPSGSPDPPETSTPVSTPQFDPGKVGGGNPSLFGFPPYPTNARVRTNMKDMIEVRTEGESIAGTSRGQGRPPQKRRAMTLSSPEVSPLLTPIDRDSPDPQQGSRDTSRTEDLLARAHDILVLLYDCPGLSKNDLAQAIQSVDAVRLRARFSPLSRSDDPWMAVFLISRPIQSDWIDGLNHSIRPTTPRRIDQSVRRVVD